jgi:hypothetical protein
VIHLVLNGFRGRLLGVGLWVQEIGFGSPRSSGPTFRLEVVDFSTDGLFGLEHVIKS